MVFLSIYYSIIYTDETAPAWSMHFGRYITALFKDYTTISVIEATPDFLEILHKRANGKQQHHDGGQHTDDDSGTSKEGIRKCYGVKTIQFLIELFPLQLKTFVITLQ